MAAFKKIGYPILGAAELLAYGTAVKVWRKSLNI
jgi:hypothetical protein